MYTHTYKHTFFKKKKNLCFVSECSGLTMCSTSHPLRLMDLRWWRQDSLPPAIQHLHAFLHFLPVTLACASSMGSLEADLWGHYIW